MGKSNHKIYSEWLKSQEDRIDDAQESLDTNVGNLKALVREVLPQMRRQMLGDRRIRSKYYNPSTNSQGYLLDPMELAHNPKRMKQLKMKFKSDVDPNLLMLKEKYDAAIGGQSFDSDGEAKREAALNKVRQIEAIEKLKEMEEKGE